MTKQKAVLMTLEIIAECKEHNPENDSCNGCPLGKGGRCLVSGGNDLPTDWNINYVLNELLKE